jgi:hypothetical protein
VEGALNSAARFLLRTRKICDRVLVARKIRRAN